MLARILPCPLHQYYYSQYVSVVRMESSKRYVRNPTARNVWVWVRPEAGCQYKKVG